MHRWWIDRMAAVGSIRHLVQLMVVVIFMPMTLMLIYSGYRSYERALAQAKQEAQSLAQITADHVEGVVHQAETVLKALATRPGIRAQSAGAPCDPVFADVLAINTQFANFNQVNLAGDVMCSSVKLPVGRTINVRGTPWFPRMQKEKRFLVSEPFLGPVSKRYVAIMSQPVRGEDGDMVGSIQLPLDLVKFKLLGSDSIPASMVITVVDANGTVVARSQEPERYVGRNLMDRSEIVRHVVANHRGAQLARSSEGVERIYGFVPIDGTSWYAVVGLDAESVLGGVRRSAVETFLISVLVAVLVLLGVRALQRQIVEPISALNRVAGRVAAGDGAVRAPVKGPAEVQAVAAQFNTMLDALDLQVRRLATSEAELRGLFAGSLEGIMRVSEDGRILSANPAACTLLLRSSDSLQGLPVSEVLGGLASDGRAWWPEILRLGEIRADLQVPLEGGRALPCEMSAFVQSTNEGGRAVNVFIRDMTDRLKQTELFAAKEAADIASKAKSAFLARMSHELRTPLNAILGFAQLQQLTPSLRDQPKVLEMNRLIHEAGQHLLALIEEVLDLSRIESGQLLLSAERIDLGALVQSCLTLVEQLAQGRGVSLRPSIGPGVVFVLGDTTRIRQVVLNLLSNAIKYNRPSGTVYVRLSAQDGRARAEIEDTGPGLSPEQLANLYQPFNRLGAEHDQSVQGAGLGLVIAKQLMEAMGGTIRAHSVVGVGTTFTIELPLAPTAS